MFSLVQVLTWCPNLGLSKTTRKLALGVYYTDLVLHRGPILYYVGTFSDFFRPIHPSICYYCFLMKNLYVIMYRTHFTLTSVLKLRHSNVFHLVLKFHTISISFELNIDTKEGSKCSYASSRLFIVDSCINTQKKFR